jgi:hypothetical protein
VRAARLPREYDAAGKSQSVGVRRLAGALSDSGSSMPPAFSRRQLASRSSSRVMRRRLQLRSA